MRTRRRSFQKTAMACLAALALALTACTFGSATTQRPALPRPAVEPDGAFWDAVETSRRGNAAGLLHLLSPRMLHDSFIPTFEIPEPTSQQQFNDLRTQLDDALADRAESNGLDLDAEKQRLAEGYMERIRGIAEENFLEASRPHYEILYTNEHGYPYGPNLAWIDVTLHPRGPAAPDEKPAVMRIRFIQDGHRWLIESLPFDQLEGRFIWPR